MVDPHSLMKQIVTVLKTLPDITVYDGIVPVTLPQDGQYIRPYIVVWAGIGDEPEEVTAQGTKSYDSIILDFQTTAIGASSDTCRQVAQVMKGALANIRMGTGRIRTNPDGFNQQNPIPDTSESPAVFMLPIQWRLLTN